MTARPPAPPPDAPLWAPVRERAAHWKPWEGRFDRKPWDYTVTAAIPVISLVETLPLIVETLRLQTEPPYILLIDTGSTEWELAAVDALRAEDVEVHSLRIHGVQHPSDFPAIAMDLAFALCRTRYLFCTHSDCFLRRRDLLAEMVDLARKRSPVVGYELSPRSHPDWRGMVGHTCTLLDMQVMDEIGAGWSMRRLARRFGVEDHRPDPTRPNWPDTELLLNYQLRENGIAPHLIGHEHNGERTLDSNIDHCRSLSTSKLYTVGHQHKMTGWLPDALAQARDRIASWRKEAGS